MNKIIYCCMKCGNRICQNCSLYGSGICRSCGTKGKNNPMYGKKLLGEKNGMFGKHHSELTKEEVVHHKDLNKLNDNISNLILCKSNSYHIKHFHSNNFKR